MSTYYPLHIPDLAEEQLDALEAALLRARASELSEYQRLNRLGSTGYGDRAGGSDSQSVEMRKANERYEALNVVLEAIRETRFGPKEG